MPVQSRGTSGAITWIRRMHPLPCYLRDYWPPYPLYRVPPSGPPEYCHQSYEIWNCPHQQTPRRSLPYVLELPACSTLPESTGIGGDRWTVPIPPMQYGDRSGTSWYLFAESQRLYLYRKINPQQLDAKKRTLRIYNTNSRSWLLWSFLPLRISRSWRNLLGYLLLLSR